MKPLWPRQLCLEACFIGLRCPEKGMNWMTTPGHFCPLFWDILEIRCQWSVADQSCHLESSIPLDVREGRTQGRKNKKRNVFYTGFKISDSKKTNLELACSCCNSVRTQSLFIFFSEDVKGPASHHSLKERDSLAWSLLLNRLSLVHLILPRLSGLNNSGSWSLYIGPLSNLSYNFSFPISR